MALDERSPGLRWPGRLPERSDLFAPLGEEARPVTALDGIERLHVVGEEADASSRGRRPPPAVPAGAALPK
jgi:hypothetical protein